LDQLYKKPQATVLIVEGEKTADAAQNMFSKDEIVVVTWPGGSAATSKADWIPVAFRDIIIWPDNDTPGFKACDAICGELRRLGVKSLKVVDRDVLRKEFPEKWDLADPLPEKQNKNVIKDLFANAEEKAVGILDLFYSTYPERKPTNVDLLKAQEVLWRVDLRLRASLETEFKGKTWEIRSKIIQEASTILSRENEIIEKLQKESGFNKAISNPLAYATMAFQAGKGSDLSHEKLSTLKDSIQNMDPNFGKELKSELREYVISKQYILFLELGIRKQHSEVIQSHFSQEVINMEKQCGLQLHLSMSKRQISNTFEKGI
jgi:5S rRNA maturation endonuclease (ribonuclease M5)